MTSVLLGHSRKDDKLEQTQLCNTTMGQMYLPKLHKELKASVAEVQVDKQLESVDEDK